MDVDNRTNKVQVSRTFRIMRDIFGLSQKSVLDVGCGFGEYLRHFGPDSIGITTTDNEIDYGKENGLNIVFGNAEKIADLGFSKKFDAIWANNLFEHLLSPHAFLIKLKTVSKPDAVAIIGVPVIPKLESLIYLKWFRGSLASNHVSFFTRKTLVLSVERAGWKIIGARPFFFKNKFLDFLCSPFAPHLYIVAMNDSNFKYPEKKLKEWVTDSHYADLLAITGQSKHRSS